MIIQSMGFRRFSLSTCTYKVNAKRHGFDDLSLWKVRILRENDGRAKTFTYKINNSNPLSFLDFAYANRKKLHPRLTESNGYIHGDPHTVFMKLNHLFGGYLPSFLANGWTPLNY